jgi:hypothetical protein
MDIFFLTLLVLLSGCSGLEESEKERIRKMNATGEYIYRSHDEIYFAIPPLAKWERPLYPWENTYVGNQLRITKDFFRCKGDVHHAPRTGQSGNDPIYILDCGGMQHHSLPLRNGKEFIYPALIEILNYIQEVTKKQVVITCGHRCPTHNTYADSSNYNRTSKHMIGAEVDFYVKGMEWRPQDLIPIIQEYYRKHPRFKADTRFIEFSRFEKETNVSTLPWFNKETFIKLYKRDEGRDLDNEHRFPYLSIQLKWDRETDQPVTYTWGQAFNGYLRY